MEGARRSLTYRPEIDGLRAVAVLSVIAFHAGATQFHGGFVGVDAFYVISGFLITRIVTEGLDEGRFSFLEFYTRRIKRLAPASTLLLFLTLAFGVLILTPAEYVELAKSTVYAAAFLANVWFMRNSGYFDQGSEYSPLVHMWSLAVEEQFYLVFPSLLAVAFSLFGRRGLLPVVLVVSGFSFALSVGTSVSQPNFAFYLLPTRAWELGVGAAFAFLPRSDGSPSAPRAAWALAGVVALVVSIFTYTHDLVYPGYAAALPVLGTAVVLYGADSRHSWVGRVLSISPMVLVGRFSYSAYLWHWPIVVYYRIYKGGEPFVVAEVIGLVLAALGIGYLSWRFVEEPCRRAVWSASSVFAGFSICTGGVLAAALLVHQVDGFRERVPDAVRPISDAKEMWQWECGESIAPIAELDEQFCVVGSGWSEAKIRGVVWGDSHSQHWAPMLDREARKHGISLVIAPLKCPPYLDGDSVREHYIRQPRFTEDCARRNAATTRWINADPTVQLIVMAAAWSGHIRMLYTDAERTNKTSVPIEQRSADVGARLKRVALERAIDRLDLTGRRVLLLGDVPRPNRDLNRCAILEAVDLMRRPCSEPHRFLDAQEIRAWHRASDEVLVDVAASRENVDVILPVEILCDALRCSTYLNGELLYRDSNHFRRNLEPETVRQAARDLGLAGYLDRLPEVLGRADQRARRSSRD